MQFVTLAATIKGVITSQMTASKFVIGLDILGGDLPPYEILEPLIARLNPKATYRLYLTENLAFDSLPPHIEQVVVSEVISMSEKPLVAARTKRHSSMAIGLQDLANNTIDAFISQGNTGALITLAKKILPKISKPALIAVTTKGLILDAGAHVTLDALDLLQFARLGVMYQKMLGLKDPKVALLNIGHEPTKGRAEHRAFFELPKDFNFIGNIESEDVFRGKADVIVTDGFSGNLFLKTVEASFAAAKAHLSFRTFPGAILGGVGSLVIKCHGKSNHEDFVLSIDQALELLAKEFFHKMKQAL
ncbi:MAG: phosphate acyltransferase [Chlamydiae bacterium]|nr:phosphate acyltransferase [Chlamydiota bacterium]